MFALRAEGSSQEASYDDLVLRVNNKRFKMENPARKGTYFLFEQEQMVEQELSGPE